MLTAFRKLNRHPGLALYPILLDFLSFFLGLSLIGFGSDSKLSFHIVLEMGLPSVHHLLDTPLFANGLNMLGASGHSALVLPVVAVMIFFSTFAQGGYIASLRQIAEGKRVTFPQFLRYGRDYWLRFALFNAIVYIGKMTCVLLSVLLFANIGPAAALILFVVFRVMYAYAEFTLIVDNARLAEAFRNSLRYMKSSFFPTVGTMAVMFVVAGSMSALLQRVWTPAAVLLGIVVYDYVMSGIQLSLMLLLQRTRKDNADGLYMQG